MRSAPKLMARTSSFAGGPDPAGAAQLVGRVRSAQVMNTDGEPGPLQPPPATPGGARMSAGSQPLGPLGATEKRGTWIKAGAVCVTVGVELGKAGGVDVSVRV